MILSTRSIGRILSPLLGFIIAAGCATAHNPVTGGSTPLGAGNRVAVLPVMNASGSSAPLEEIRGLLIEGLKERGFVVLEDDALDAFMERHRMRDTGGIDGSIAKALRDETGTNAVLITMLELYDDESPPKIALTSRLVETRETPVIDWMDSIALTGDEYPGLLGLGLIDDPKRLDRRALGYLMDSLPATLSGERRDGGTPGKYRPKVAYHSGILDPAGRYSVAVLPFHDQSGRKHAGEILALHFVGELTRLGRYDVIEPGVIRRELLNFRIIMEDGVSLDDADVILAGLNADLLVTGKVIDYRDVQGAWGAPVVDFSALMIEKKSREVVWASKSYNTGSDGVYFFNWRRAFTAGAMASEMVRSIGRMTAR